MLFSPIILCCKCIVRQIKPLILPACSLSLPLAASPRPEGTHSYTQRIQIKNADAPKSFRTIAFLREEGGIPQG